MSTVTSSCQVIPPQRVRGIKKLNKTLFEGIYHVPSLIITTQHLSPVLRPLRKYMLKLDNFKPLQPLESDGNVKIAYLDPSIVSKFSDIHEDDRAIVSLHNVSSKHFNVSPLKISYEQWRCEDIIKAIVPEDVESVSGYSLVGHIVHVNLREHLLDYKEIIGEVLLDKIKNAKTVVNKVNSIDNTYRNFKMEVLSGEENFVCTVKENKCTFEFDFSKVYWNSRLCTEHERVANALKNGDVLFDVFAGVGPFTIPALRKKCTVFANDLNPDSFEWLNHNAKLNKVAGNNFKSYNLDGRQFIRDVVGKELIAINKNPKKNVAVHVTMNLPAIALEFLDAFHGLLADEEDFDEFIEPTIHVYCFTIGDDSEETAKQMLQEHLKYPLSILDVEVSFVRDVSPKKDMMKLTFNLPKTVLYTVENKNNGDNLGEPPEKLKKLN